MKVVLIPEKCEIALDLLKDFTVALSNQLEMNEEENDFLMTHCKPIILNEYTKRAERNEASIGLKDCSSGKRNKYDALWMVTETFPDGTCEIRLHKTFRKLVQDIERMPL
jgi:hypothetical protein